MRAAREGEWRMDASAAAKRKKMETEMDGKKERQPRGGAPPSQSENPESVGLRGANGRARADSEEKGGRQKGETERAVGANETCEIREKKNR